MTCIKVVELVGCSEKGFDEALNAAVDRALKTIRNVTGVNVLGKNMSIKDGKIKEYKVNVKVAFKVD